MFIVEVTKEDKLCAYDSSSKLGLKDMSFEEIMCIRKVAKDSHPRNDLDFTNHDPSRVSYVEKAMVRRPIRKSAKRAIRDEISAERENP